MKRLPAAVLAGCGALLSTAQDAALRGRVTDAATKEALIGVHVTHAPGKGTATAADGTYELVLPPGEHTVSFNFIGYATRRETITLVPGEARTLDVALGAAATQLDMVVVTAGRFEQRVGEVAQSLSVLRPDIVLNKNVTSMDQALDQIPGVVVIDEDPQIRAGSGFSYGAGSRVQVLVDDIPILSGDIGRPNWSFLPLENLEQVEVIKGASSVLHGSAALSGVINVRTAYPRSEPRTRATLFAGVYGTPGNPDARWWGDNAPMLGGASFFHSRQVGKLDLVLGGNAFSDAGHVGPEPLSLDTLAADPLRVGPGGYDQRVRFNTGLRWRNGKVKGLSYGIATNAMKSRNTSVLIWNDTGAGLYRPKTGTVTRTLGGQYYVDPRIDYVSPGGTRHSLRGRMHRQEFDNDNDQSNSNTTLHGEYQFQRKVEALGGTMVTAGLMVRRTHSDAVLYTGDADGDGRNTADNTAAYLQLDRKFLDRLALSAGVRHERFKVNDDAMEQPVFRAGGVWQALQATFVRASYGESFRFPTIGERFISTSVGRLRILPNPGLRAERGRNIEGGVKQGFKVGNFMGYVDAVVFRQDYDDYVEFTFGQWALPDIQVVGGRPVLVDPGLGFKSVNTGSARITGYELELTGTGNIGAVRLSALMGWTWTKPVSTTPHHVYATPAFQGSTPYSYISTSSDTTDHILKFRVRSLLRADVQAEHKRLMAGISVRYNSHVRNIDRVFVDLDESTNPLVRLETGVSRWMRDHRTGDTIVDVRAGYSLSEGTRLALIVNNLTNEVYSLRPLSIEAPRSVQLQFSVDI